MAENEHGGISIELEHIFPIIKKWLYSEKEIFLREIVSNACDAVTKLKRLVSLGEAGGVTGDFGKITVSLNSEAKTITVTDDGIGMTEEELRNYICKIALSGALDFIQKYEGTEDGAGAGIIGHFGLGFYSSFMVSDTVDVITRSFTGAPASMSAFRLSSVIVREPAACNAFTTISFCKDLGLLPAIKNLHIPA